MIRPTALVVTAAFIAAAGVALRFAPTPAWSPPSAATLEFTAQPHNPVRRAATDPGLIARVERAPAYFAGDADNSAASLDGLRVTGVILGERRAWALFAMPGGSVNAVALNGEISGWQVVRIAPSEVTIRRGQQERGLRLFENRMLSAGPTQYQAAPTSPPDAPVNVPTQAPSTDWALPPPPR